MGLTIHYTLRPGRLRTVVELKRVLRRLQRLARKNGCVRVGKVLPAAESDPEAPEFFDCAPGHERRLHNGGAGTEGWLLEVWPGEGCETMVFGLVAHRRELRRKGPSSWRRRYAKRRYWRRINKTQYWRLFY